MQNQKTQQTSFRYYYQYYAIPYLLDKFTDLPINSKQDLTMAQVELFLKKEAVRHTPTFNTNRISLLYQYRQRPKFCRTRFIPKLRTAKVIERNAFKLTLRGLRCDRFLSELLWEKWSNPSFLSEIQCYTNSRSVRLSLSGRALTDFFRREFDSLRFDDWILKLRSGRKLKAIVTTFSLPLSGREQNDILVRRLGFKRLN